MEHPEEHARLTDEEYAWVMHCAKRGGAFGDPDENLLFQAQYARLAASIPDREHLERTAYHEAAHAVVAHALGFEVIRVSIDVDRGSETQWYVPSIHTPTPKQALRNLLDQTAVKVAGYVVEEMKWGRGRGVERGLLRQVASWRRELFAIERPLPKEIHSALPGVEERPAELAIAALVEHQETVARAILLANWTTIDRLAALLITHRTARREQLVAILTDAPSNPPLSETAS